MQNLKLVSSKKGEDTENLERIDFNIWVALIFLCCFGLIMVLSASSYKCASSESYKYDSMYFFKRQLLFILAGFASILFLRKSDYRKLRHVAFLAWIMSLVCIFLLLTPLGIYVNGAKRWLGYGAVRFQVAELVKIAVILFLASLVTKYSYALNKVLLTFVLWGAGGIPAILLFVISNDLSSAIIVLAITFGISFVCTKTFKLHMGTLAAVLALAVAYVLNIWYHLPTEEELANASFRVARIAAWLAPERYSSDSSYQTLQALYAIGNGGLLGKSLGNSTQKLYAIPEAHTDMIFSIVCEELGLLGATLLISLFLYLLYQLLRLALSTKDLFGSVIVLGVFLHISAQTMINLAVNVNLFPNTGLTLPFISYGGTSVLLLLLEMSIVFSIIHIRMSRPSEEGAKNPLRQPTPLQKVGKKLSRLPLIAALQAVIAVVQEYLNNRLTLLDQILLFSDMMHDPQSAAVQKRLAAQKSAASKHTQQTSSAGTGHSAASRASRDSAASRASRTVSASRRSPDSRSLRSSGASGSSATSRSSRASAVQTPRSSRVSAVQGSRTSGSTSASRVSRNTAGSRRSSDDRAFRSLETSVSSRTPRSSRASAARTSRSSEAVRRSNSSRSSKTSTTRTVRDADRNPGQQSYRNTSRSRSASRTTKTSGGRTTTGSSRPVR